MILAHIIFSVIGIFGSYFRLIYRKGNWFVWIGLLGVIGSGIVLFIRDQEMFLDSSKFLSNMTVMAVLLITEILYLISNDFRRWFVFISTFSWTWIFFVAIINPFSYWVIIGSYLLILLLTLYIVYVSGILKKSE
jgi:hypothetical protein